jgi:hypothetical protein
MQIGRSLKSITALVTLMAADSSMATAQTGRAWVDPPARIAPAPSQAPAPPQTPPPESPPPQAATPAPAPAAPPAQTAQPQAPVAKPEAPTSAQTEPPPAARPSAPTVAAQPPKEPEGDKRSARATVARDFAIDYLASWSASNEVALEATAAFYAPRILFHGREMTMKRLFNEKRRFAKRWPERDYRPRQDAIGATCNPAGEVCTVHAVFDFKASNSKRRRVSQGTGALQLIVNFIGDKPVIVAEHSTLLGQERKRNLVQEGASHD